MKFKFKLKEISVHSKIIFLILFALIIIDGVVFTYFPAYVLENQKKHLKNSFIKEADFTADLIDKAARSKDEFFIRLTKYLKRDREVVYIAANVHLQTIIYPDYFEFNKIKNITPDKIIYLNEKHVLPILFNISKKKHGKAFNIYAGLNAEHVINEYYNAYKVVAIFIIATMLLAYLLIFFINKKLNIPLKKLRNITRLIASGQTSFEKEIQASGEFKEINKNIKEITKTVKELQGIKEDTPFLLEKAVERTKLAQESLDYELEIMSGLAFLSPELRKEKSKEAIFNRIINDITERFRYHISFIFVKEGNFFRYYGSNIKGLDVINNKLKKECSDCIIPENSKEFKEMERLKPYITNKPYFNTCLEKFNLKGNFAFVPIASYGLLVVGYLGENKIIREEDTGKMMLLSNMVALNIDNLEALATLERNVKLRTAELETTNKLLSDSIQEKDNMIKLVSHDLNAPLRNVIGLVDSIQRKYDNKLEKDIFSRLERIRNNVKKEMQMVKDILGNFSSLEQNNSISQIDMNEMINSIQEDLNYELEKKNVSVILEKKLPIINSNHHIIKHIFLNLIDNACKYLPEDRDNNTIKILYSQTDENIIFSVEDNGIGIPVDKQDDIFLRYKKLSDENQSGLIGTGLGLALIKNMVEKLSGKVWLESHPGKGSKFFISLRKIDLNREQ